MPQTQILVIIQMDLFGQEIDQEELKKKIERVIQNLERSPKEKQ